MHQGGPEPPTPSGPSAPTPTPPPLTPPTVRGALAVRAPVWPTAVGALGVVLGALGVLGAVWTIIAPALLDVRPMGGLEGFEPGGAASLVIIVVNLGLSVLLIVGASLLLCRRRRAIAVLCVYAVAAIVAGLVSTGWAFVLLAEHASRAAPQPGTPAPALVASMGVVGGCIGLVFSIAFPGFLLVWLTRASVKSDIARWVTGGARAGR